MIAGIDKLPLADHQGQDVQSRNPTESTGVPWPISYHIQMAEKASKKQIAIV